MDILHEALSYGARGWRVVILHGMRDGKCTCPKSGDCPDPAKHPRLKDWPTHATCDAKAIESFWQRWPESNVGIRLGPDSGLVDIEYDSGEGRATANELLGACFTPTYRSHRSTHRLFRFPAQLTIRKAVVTVRGLELRFGTDAKGSQSVFPPSRHAAGITYGWLPGLSPDDVDLLPFPDSLRELTGKVNGQELLVFENHFWDTPGANKGQRTYSLWRLIGRFLHEYGPHESLMSHALAWAAKCQPPLEPEAVRKAVDGLVAKHLGKQRPIESPTQPSVLRGIPITQLGLAEPPGWLWEGLIAKECATLLSSVWKVGKSTLLAHLLQQAGQGGELGFAVEQFRAYVLSEENASIWHGRREDLGLGDWLIVDPRPFKGRPSADEWLAYCAALADAVAKGDIQLVVVDTWSQLTPAHRENAAEDVTGAFLPLRQITDKGGALLVFHHTNKADASEGKAARGSGALPAAFDIIVEMRRARPGDRQDTCRIFTCWGRFDDIAPEFTLQLTPEGYRAVDVMRGPRLSKSSEAAGWLQAQLVAGAKAANEILELGKAANYPERTLRRAKTELGIGSIRINGEWHWVYNPASADGESILVL